MKLDKPYNTQKISGLTPLFSSTDIFSTKRTGLTPLVYIFLEIEGGFSPDIFVIKTMINEQRGFSPKILTIKTTN